MIRIYFIGLGSNLFAWINVLVDWNEFYSLWVVFMDIVFRELLAAIRIHWDFIESPCSTDYRIIWFGHTLSATSQKFIRYGLNLFYRKKLNTRWERMITIIDVNFYFLKYKPKTCPIIVHQINLLNVKNSKLVDLLEMAKKPREPLSLLTTMRR